MTRSRFSRNPAPFSRAPHRGSFGALFIPVVVVVTSVVTWVVIPGAARAEMNAVGPSVDLRAQLDGGAGMHESSLPGTGTGATRRVAAAWFPSAGFRLALFQAPDRRVRFGGELNYVSSIGYELSRPIEPNTSEQSPARTQEFLALASLSVALSNRAQPIALPISLGYGLSALTTDSPLTAAHAYLVSGPRAGLGIELPLFAGRLQLSARGEIGAIVTATQALRGAGADSVGWAYAFQAEAGLRLGSVVQLGLRYREGRAELPLSGSGSFHELHRFLLACVTLRNPR